MAFPLIPSLPWFGLAPCGLWTCLSDRKDFYRPKPFKRDPSSYKKSRTQSSSFPEPPRIQQRGEIAFKPCWSFVSPRTAPNSECLKWEEKLTMRIYSKLTLLLNNQSSHCENFVPFLGGKVIFIFLGHPGRNSLPRLKFGLNVQTLPGVNVPIKLSPQWCWCCFCHSCLQEKILLWQTQPPHLHFLLKISRDLMKIKN